MSGHTFSRPALLFGVVTLLLAMLPLASAEAQTSRRCFAETGFCIEGRIREFWEQNGGLPVFGLPTGSQQEEQIEGNPLQAQWFERNRLELHPENARPYDVLLGRLGADRLSQIGVNWFQLPRGEARPGCRFFAETGHSVCDLILSAWRAKGLEFDGRRGTSEAESLALFGAPLGEASIETIAGKAYTVQWFERARFELHPENAPPYNVLLGLLGNEVHSPVRDIFAQVGAGAPFVFVNPPGALDVQITQDADCRHSGQRGLRLTYGFTGAGNGGWGMAWNDAPGGVFDAMRFNTLSFWVRGTAPNGFQIGLKDSSEHEIKLEARDLVTVSQAEWRKVSVALGRFADQSGPVQLAQVRNMNIGFNPSHGAGSVCIADIAFEAPLADIFPQVGAGQAFEYVNPPGMFIAQFVEDEPCRRSGQYGLRIGYGFSGDGFGGWGVQWSGASGGSFDAAQFRQLSLWVKGTAPGGFHIGLKDTNEREVKVEAKSYVMVGPDAWQEVWVPLSAFADGGVSLAALRNLNLGFNRDHGAGELCVDDIAFE